MDLDLRAGQPAQHGAGPGPGNGRRAARNGVAGSDGAGELWALDARELAAPAHGAGPSDAALRALGARFERQHPTEVIRWAVREFHPHLCLTASMTDTALVDMAVGVEPDLEVVFIDTGYHFPETLETLERVRRRYALNLRILTMPRHDPPLWQVDPQGCCSAAKVAQLDRALAGKRAWMSGIRRSESPERAAVPIVARDHRGLVKINPLATWTDADLAAYIADHDVPVNPLLAQGYPSIGCAPCTSPVADGAHPRSGRWAGLGKTECGLHL